MKICIYTAQISNGIRVIIDNLIKKLKERSIEAVMIMDLSEAAEDDYVIPYGIKESIQLSKTNRPLDISFLVDAVSLGYLNKIKFYVKKGLVFRYDFFYSVYAYIKWSRQDKRMPSLYKEIMMVSQTDIDYIKKLAPKNNCNFICVKNGANIENIKPKDISNNFRIGVLCDWTLKLVFQESDWFVFRYFRKFSEDHPNVKLIIAGRGELANSFKKEKNVEVMGEVGSLDEFFSKIDLFVAVNPKGCGILNRVLDSYVHKTCVLGLPAVFSGFPQSDKFSYKFDTYESFVERMEYIMNHTNERKKFEEDGYRYVRENYDWDKNYTKLAEKVIEISNCKK